MVNRVLITGKIVVKTNNKDSSRKGFTRISAIDSLLAQKFSSGEIFIHGEQLKKKICTILEKYYPKKIYKPTDKEWMIARVFGTGSGDRKMMGRLVFLDMEEVECCDDNDGKYILKNSKGETLKHTTVFNMKMVYDVEKEAEFIDDMQILLEGLQVIEDYIEKRSSSGEEVLKFYNVQAKLSGGFVAPELVDATNEMLRKMA